MRYLVIGGTGFVGRNLVKHLLATGGEVVLALRDKQKIVECGWYEVVETIDFDLNEPGNLQSCKVDCVFNLAWEGLPNYGSPLHLTKNLVNQIRLMQKLIEDKYPKIVVTGTCMEYGMKYGQLNENMSCEPINTYAIAKDSLRRVSFGLCKDTQSTVIWARLFYMYGRFQKATSLIGQLDKAISSRDATFRMSGGEQLRDYMDILDVVKCLYQLSQNVNHSDVVNVASGQPISVRGLVERVCRERGVEMDLELGYYPYSDYEPMAFWADTAKLNRFMTGVE